MFENYLRRIVDGRVYDDVIKWEDFPRNWLLWGDSSVTGDFTTHAEPVSRSFDIFFDMHQNEWLSKKSRRRWFEAPSY